MKLQDCKTLDDIRRYIVMLENDCTSTAMVDLSELSYALNRAAEIGGEKVKKEAIYGLTNAEKQRGSIRIVRALDVKQIIEGE